MVNFKLGEEMRNHMINMSRAHDKVCRHSPIFTKKSVGWTCLVSNTEAL